MKKLLSIALIFSSLLFISCSTEGNNEAESLEQNNQELIAQLSRISNTNNVAKNASQGKEPKQQPPIWADCMVYSGIVVPATFKPESDPFDELYVMPDHMFAEGLPLISESKPGDKDYNGGRWHLNVLKEGVDPSKYADACRAEDLDTNDFASTDMYFGCPLRPRN